MGSLRRLAHQLIEKGVASYLIPSWENTLAFEGHHHNIANHPIKHTEKQDQAQREGIALEHQVSKIFVFVVVSDFSLSFFF